MADYKNKNDYAVIIGINDYPDFISLKGANGDATDIHKWLTDENKGSIPPQNCKLITSTEDPLIPGKTQIDRGFRAILDSIKEKPKRRFYFYFSGHGVGLDTKEVSLCYTDWNDFNTPKASILALKYLETIKLSGIFNEIIFILDCCRLTVRNVDGEGPIFKYPTNEQQAGFVKDIVIYATSFAYAAREAANPDQLNFGIKEYKGNFTKAFLEALTGNNEAVMPSGDITIASLREYLKKRVKEICISNNQPIQETNIVLGSGLTDSDILFSDLPIPLKEHFENKIYKLTINNASGSDVTLSNATIGEIKVSHTQVFPLMSGRYTITIKQTDTIKSEEIILVNDTVFTVEEVQRLFSAVPFSGTETKHEYYTESAENASRNITKQLTDSPNSSILLLIRYPDASKVDSSKNLGENLILTDANGNVLSRFKEDELYKHPNFDYKVFGYLAFSAKATAGLYYLKYFGEKANREIPIYLYNNWQTQVFIMYNQQILFDTTRIWMDRNNFSADSFESKNLEMGLITLQNPTIPVSAEVLDSLLQGKFENPMVGIVGKYLLLQGKILQTQWYKTFLEYKKNREGQSDESLIAFEKDFFITVVSNLSNLLGNDAPDVMAIRYLASAFVPELKNGNDGKPIKLVFNNPPSFNWGLQQIIERSASDPNLILPSSIIIEFATRLYADSAYSSWRHDDAYPITDSVTKSLDQPKANKLDGWVCNAVFDSIINSHKNEVDEKVGIDTVGEALDIDTINETQWIDIDADTASETVIKGNDFKNIKIDFAAIAKQLKLPQATIENALKSIANDSSTQENVLKRYSEKGEEYYRNFLESVSNVYNQPIKTLPLKNVKGIGQIRELKLSEFDILNVEGLVKLYNDTDRINEISSSLKVSFNTVTDWVNQAKNLIS